jgi:hypothetical protein
MINILILELHVRKIGKTLEFCFMCSRPGSAFENQENSYKKNRRNP